MKGNEDRSKRDAEQDNAMTTEQCERLSSSKGSGDTAKHRCDQKGSPGTELPEAREWIHKQHKTTAAINPAKSQQSGSSIAEEK